MGKHVPLPTDPGERWREKRRRAARCNAASRRKRVQRLKAHKAELLARRAPRNLLDL